MKITIIGDNPEYFNFLQNFELVTDISNADIVIFSNHFNYRSAAMKFNKISKDKLVIGIGETGLEFLIKRYGGAYIFKEGSIKKVFKNNSLQVYNTTDNVIYECVPHSYLIRPKCNYKIIGSCSFIHYNLGSLTKNEVAFIQEHNFPVVTIMKSENKPFCLLLGLNPQYISKTSISEYINYLICTYNQLL